MTLRKIKLTPKIAAKLLADPHEKQRDINQATVDDYVDLWVRGLWTENYDPILVAGRSYPGAGKMFNGGHRCSMVLMTNEPMEVWYDDDADPAIFVNIDAGRPRRAYQFLHKKSANTRTAAVRVMYWYDNAFDMPMDNRVKVRQEELIVLAKQWEDELDLLLPLGKKLHRRTTIPPSVTLGAMLIAFREGYEEAAVAFAERVSDPINLDPLDPAWRLIEKMMGYAVVKGKRRRNIEDWTLFVRCLNADLLDDTLPKKLYSSRVSWPRVAESEAAYNRRASALSSKKRRDGS